MLDCPDPKENPKYRVSSSLKHCSLIYLGKGEFRFGPVIRDYCKEKTPLCRENSKFYPHALGGDCADPG